MMTAGFFLLGILVGVAVTFVVSVFMERGE